MIGLRYLSPNGVVHYGNVDSSFPIEPQSLNTHVNSYPALPPGQREINTFPRFGLTPFAKRFSENVGEANILIGGDVQTPVQVGPELERVPRVEQYSDFHFL